jgi:hypothetical protein
MELVQTTKNVITDAIKKRASKNGLNVNEVQLTIYPKSANEIGLVWLKNGKAEAQTKIGNILTGLYALAIPKVNSTIYNSFDKFSKLYQTQIVLLKANMYLEDNVLKCDLFLNGEKYKEITIEEIIN